MDCFQFNWINRWHFTAAKLKYTKIKEIATPKCGTFRWYFTKRYHNKPYLLDKHSLDSDFHSWNGNAYILVSCFLLVFIARRKTLRSALFERSTTGSLFHSCWFKWNSDGIGWRRAPADVWKWCWIVSELISHWNQLSVKFWNSFNVFSIFFGAKTKPTTEKNTRHSYSSHLAIWMIRDSFRFKL